MTSETNTSPAKPGGAERGQMFRWTPSEDLIKTAIGAAFAAAGLLGIIGFGESFGSLMTVAAPYLGWASWVLPVIIDLGILVLTVLGLVLALAGMPSRILGLVPVGLSVWTLYLNTADVHSMIGKAVHGAGPTMWILVVEAGGMALRRLTGLSAGARMDKVRTSRWLLAPVATFRLWRRMRLWEITSYKTAVAREQQQGASRALLREWHGRSWKRTAPRAERLAVRLQAATERPVAELLAESAESIVSAAQAAVRPLSAEQQAEKAAAAASSVADQAGQGTTGADRVARTRAATHTRRVVVARARKAAQVAAQVPPPVTAQVPRPKAAKAPVKAAAKRPAPLPKHPVRRTDAELMIEARAVNEQAIAKTGAPAGVDRLKAGLGIGQERARKFRALLDAETAAPAPVAVPATAPVQVHPVALPIAHANGSQVPLAA